ncbi:MAG: TIGR01459 family HAD-type hydrolase [Paracoccaceae bacterium]|nr:TIGR01459 family HAD-type hydrolase [Paracoccaceae bacterium]
MACQIVTSLDRIWAPYRALFVDLWGCYHNGITPYPAAVAALQAYRAQGGIAILLTNAPRPAGHVERFLDRIGAPKDSYDGIMSSGGACQRALASGDYGRAFHYVGPDRDRHMLSGVGLDDMPLGQADGILLTGLRDDMTETPDDYAAEIAEWKARALPVLCANPDLIVDRGEQRLFCAGALALAYEQAGGEVIWFGKPHGPTYEQTFGLLAEIAGEDIPKAQVLAIGDGIQTDVKGGLDYGLDVLFITGGLATGELGPDPERPEAALLEAYLAAHASTPRFAIGRLR